MTQPFRVGNFSVRPYDHAKDIKAVQRIWRECGWHNDSDAGIIDDFYSVGETHVAALDGEAECAAHISTGTMRYQEVDLELCAVTAVLTSAIARKRGLGQAATAQAICEAVGKGADIAALGIFEQGYYDRLGFGSGPYEHVIAFDPSDLNRQKVGDFRIPRRITPTDWLAMSEAMKSRWIGHGGCTLHPAELVKCEAAWKKDGFGFGYYSDQGELTHFFFGKLEDTNGPLGVAAFAYRNGDELLELFALLRSLGDQVATVTMVEPAHLQLQDLLQQPFRFQRITKSSNFANVQRATSFWQFRILDLVNCIRKTHLDGADTEFNLVLSDPITKYFSTEQIADAETWTGSGGEYVVYLGEDSSAERGSDPNLPTLRASVNAFTRLWFGVRPATELTISDDVSGPNELLLDLDATLRLPIARLGWHF